MAYVYPCAVRSISDDFQEHLARGSVNPGTDYKAAYGSPVFAPSSGVITGTTGNSGSGGRMIYLDLDDGNGIDLLHLSSIQVGTGQRVAAGQQVGLSGASGYGDNWYYGAHLHISIRNRHGSHTSGAGNFDFDLMMANQGGGSPAIVGGVDMYGSIVGVVDGDGGGMSGAWFIMSPGHLANVSASTGQYYASILNVDTWDQRNKGQGQPNHWTLDTVQWDAELIAGAPRGTLESLYTGSVKTWTAGEGGGNGGGTPGTGPTADQIADAVGVELAPQFEAIPTAAENADATVDEFAGRLGGTRSLNFARDIAMVVIGVAIILLALLVDDPTRLVGIGLGTGVSVLGAVLLVAELRRADHHHHDHHHDHHH